MNIHLLRIQQWYFVYYLQLNLSCLQFSLYFISIKNLQKENKFQVKRTVIEMNQLLQVSKNLQWVHGILGWNTPVLPPIIFIGDTGAGKSSVLENLLGYSIFHSDDYQSTSCPIVINIKNSDKSSIKFLSKSNKSQYDWETFPIELQKEIKHNGSSYETINLEPIVVEVNQKNAACMTLIDLPGLNDPEAGDTACKTEILRKKLALKYIRSPDAIIVCVVSADTAISKSECLKLAKSIDPTGSRTILILTKLDLLDNNTLLEKIEAGLLLGCKSTIGIICRSPKCLKAKKTISDSLSKEKRFLKTHCGTSAQYHGTTYLSKVLAELLMYHIKQLLPSTVDAVQSSKEQVSLDIEFLQGQSTSKNKIILEEATLYTNAYCAALNGRQGEIETKELVGGARISYIIHEIFGKALDSIHPLHGINKAQILTALRNACGIRPDVLFIPEACFESLARRQITHLANPCRQFVDLVYEEMLRLIRDCSTPLHPGRYPKLYDLFYNVAADLLLKRRSAGAALVEDLLDMEISYINTLDPDFQKELDMSKVEWLTAKGLSVKANSLQKEKPLWPPKPNINHCMSEPSINNSFPSSSAIAAVKFTAADEPNVHLVETLLTSYFSAVRRTLKHSIPKAIMLRVVNYVHDHLYHNILEGVQIFMNGEADILQKPETMIAQCSHLEETYALLKKSETVLQEIKDTLNVEKVGT